MKNIAILENIRSVYNVWNIIRTADALGWDIVFTGYTATPESNPRVAKTSLGAEESVHRRQFADSRAAIETLRTEWYYLIAAEITERAIDLKSFSQNYKKEKPLAVVFGNEVVGVEEETLEMVDEIIFIPMQWVKESLNVWQSVAIFMWEMHV